jgi:hypothetical protein
MCVRPAPSHVRTNGVRLERFLRSSVPVAAIVGNALFGTVVGFCFAVAVYTRAKFFLCNNKISKTERIV